MDAYLELTMRVHRRALRFRCVGAASVLWAWLVSGQIQGMVLAHNNPYDVVAGHAIARAAGAICTDYAGAPLTLESSGAMAAVPGVQPEGRAATLGLEAVETARQQGDPRTVTASRGSRLGRQRAVQIGSGEDPENDGIPRALRQAPLNLKEVAYRGGEDLGNDAPLTGGVIGGVDGLARAYLLHQQLPDVFAPVVHHGEPPKHGVAAGAGLAGEDAVPIRRGHGQRPTTGAIRRMLSATSESG